LEAQDPQERNWVVKNFRKKIGLGMDLFWEPPPNAIFAWPGKPEERPRKNPLWLDI